MTRLAPVKPPFVLKPSRHIDARYTQRSSDGRERQVFRSGRSTFVWLWYVLVPLAAGSTDEVEIRLSGGKSPWHTIRATSDEAYSDLVGGWATRGILKQVDSARRMRAERSAAGRPRA